MEAYNLVTGAKLPAVAELKLGCAEMCHSYIGTKNVKMVDAVFPHSTHIKDLGIDCLDCHTPRWNHGKTVMKNCNQCHHADNPINCVNCHKEQSDLYTGVGGDGVPQTPSFKVELDVKCKDCHADVLKGKKSDLAAIKATCVGCHDEKMAAKADEWKTAGDAMLKGLREKLARAGDLLEKAGKRGINVDVLEKKFTSAEKNVALLKKGNPVHNVKFSGMLAKQANEYLDYVIRTLDSKLYG